MNTIKRFIVTAVDHGETCDGKARVLGAFKTREQAKAFVDSDMQSWLNDRIDEDDTPNGDWDSGKMMTWDIHDETIRCEWNIEEIEIEL